MRRNFRMHLDGICISGSSHLYYGNRHETHVFPGELDNNMNCSSPIAPKLNPAEVYYTFSFFFVFVMLFYILLVSFVRSFVPSFLRSFVPSFVPFLLLFLFVYICICTLYIIYYVSAFVCEHVYGTLPICTWMFSVDS